ncbi:MAG: nucleotide exchange factor GrpE [Gemmatimonadota bacterium]|nr:nucleotide exchange factor GrpE [Gemmatimonadota bacterium]
MTRKNDSTTPPDDMPGTATPGDPQPSPAATDASTTDGVAAGALEAELAEQKDKYLRLAAEYDNFRKRTVRERQDAELRGMGVLIRGLLDALDDLGRFAHVDPASVDAATVVQGAEMVEKKMLKTLAGHGLEVLNPAGEPFNPELHEAVSTTRAALPEEDHRVAQVYQVGYLFNGQLLRPARVVVTQWHDEP